MTNLDPVFCKMYLPIWIPGNVFFCGPHFPFFWASKLAIFGGYDYFAQTEVLLLKLRCTEEQVNFRQGPRLTLLKISVLLIHYYLNHNPDI